MDWKEFFSMTKGKIICFIVISINLWLQYTKIMRNVSNNLKITPRQLDMALFSMHREKLNSTGMNLY